VVIAYRLLFGVYSGIIPDGIDDLVTDDLNWAGDTTILLSNIKGRTAAESPDLPRRPVRLREQWLAHSRCCAAMPTPSGAAPAVVAAAERARRNRNLGEGRSGQPGRDPTLGGRHDLLDADGNPLKIHRSWIRTTFQSLRDKRSWAGRGRATIDPNHSPPVEGDQYLTATTPQQRQAVEAIVEHARHDLPRKDHPPTVVTDTDAATLARDYPQLVASFALDDR
jgi:hypothetical protein